MPGLSVCIGIPQIKLQGVQRDSRRISSVQENLSVVESGPRYAILIDEAAKKPDVLNLDSGEQPSLGLAACELGCFGHDGIGRYCPLLRNFLSSSASHVVLWRSWVAGSYGEEGGWRYSPRRRITEIFQGVPEDRAKRQGLSPIWFHRIVYYLQRLNDNIPIYSDPRSLTRNQGFVCNFAGVLGSFHLPIVDEQETEGSSNGGSLKPILSCWSLIWAACGFGIMGLGWSGIRIGRELYLNTMVFVFGVIVWGGCEMFVYRVP